MPLSGGGGFLSNDILEALAGGLVGFPKFPYTQAATVELEGARTQILPAATDVIREVFIRNTSTAPLTLFLGTQQITMATIQPGGHLWDTFNSGFPLEAIGTGIIEVIIRQDKVINYAIGENMVFPVGVTLRVGTGSRFQFITQDIQDEISAVFDQNVRKFLDSDDGLDGWKIACFDTFTPGSAIDFNVSVEGANYDTSQAIQFQWINTFALMRLAFAIASDVINPESVNLSSDIGGILTKSMFGGEAPGTGGVISITPNFLNIMGRFVCVDSRTGYYHTAIIKSYTPNADPLLGGTFTLEGF